MEGSLGFDREESLQWQRARALKAAISSLVQAPGEVQNHMENRESPIAETGVPEIRSLKFPSFWSTLGCPRNTRVDS